MFQTLTNVQRGDSKNLIRCIENRSDKNGELCVGLKSITYTVGWYNVETEQSLSWRRAGGERRTVEVPPGLYGFNQLKEIIESVGSFGTIEINKNNGLITLTVANNQELLLTDGLLSVLGLDDGRNGEWIDNGIYIGDSPVNFATRKVLYVHLDQINTTDNIVDGMPSNLLTSIGLGCHSFGDIATIRVEHPEYKRLQNGTISELKITIKDEYGNIINNHDLPIYITLEIKQ